MQTKLTKRIIDALETPRSVETIWDSEIPGFGLRIMPSGRKSFVLKFTASGRQRWMTLGRFGDLTVEEARRMAQARRGDVALGKDPSDEARASKGAPTMTELIDRFLEEHVKLKTRPSTAVGYNRYLKRVIEPRLGRLLVKEVTPAEVSKFHHSLKETPRQANQAVAILRKMFNQAEVWGYRAWHSNPCLRIQKNPETQRTRYLTDQEIQVLGEALTKADADRSIPSSAIAAIRLLILTGARHSEILKLRWDQVDFDRKVLTFLPDQHKTGKKSGVKTIPLNAPALDLLKEVPRGLRNPYVIQGALPQTHLVGLQKCWERLKQRVLELEAAKVKARKKTKAEAVNIDDVRIHDLRHTFASTGVSHGLSLPLIGSLLGHSQPSVTQRYAHVGADPRREASEQVGSELAKKLFASQQKKA